MRDARTNGTPWDGRDLSRRVGSPRGTGFAATSPRTVKNAYSPPIVDSRRRIVRSETPPPSSGARARTSCGSGRADSPARWAVMKPSTSTGRTSPTGLPTTAKKTFRSNHVANTVFGRERAATNSRYASSNGSPNRPPDALGSDSTGEIRHGRTPVITAPPRVERRGQPCRASDREDHLHIKHVGEIDAPRRVALSGRYDARGSDGWATTFASRWRRRSLGQGVDVEQGSRPIRSLRVSTRATDASTFAAKPASAADFAASASSISSASDAAPVSTMSPPAPM